MRSLIESSVDGKTTLRKDPIGLSFPVIEPKISKFTNEDDGHIFKEVVLRSVYSYQFGTSGYIVEIAVYRTWRKSLAKGSLSWEKLMSTTEPRIESSISMYNRMWDWTTTEAWDKTRSRNWDPQLRCFFGEEEVGDGIPKFLETTKFFLDFLTKAEQH